MKRFASVLVAVIGFISIAPAASAGDVSDATITVEPNSIELALGETTTVDVTVTNNGTDEIVGAVAHIDITDLSDDGSADAEDWASALNKDLPAIAPGESVVIQWDLQPTSPGSFTFYAVALSAEASAVAATDTVAITVTDRRSLNPNGILPVAIAAPLLVGLALASRVRRAHRS